MTQKAILLSACGELVRQNDADRFYCALMAPHDRREDLFTLLAFNQEIAKIRSIVTEPILGQMRLQWWREAIEAMAAGKPAPAHEVAQPLGALLKRKPEIALYLHELLDARERDLDETPFASVGELEAYAKASTGPLLAAMGSANDAIATGYALVGLLRAGHGRDEAMTREAAARARNLLKPAARGQARLWQAVARLYLRQLEKAGFNATADRFRQPHPLRGLVILWASLTA